MIFFALLSNDTFKFVLVTLFCSLIPYIVPDLTYRVDFKNEKPKLQLGIRSHYLMEMSEMIDFH